MQASKFLAALPLFVLLGGLAGCGDSPPPPPQVFAPLDYSYLPPIVLNVANIAVQNTYVPDAGGATLIGQDPEAPANALMAMLQHRLVADGTPGNGTATIETASLEQVATNYVGVMTVRLDLASADGNKTGSTEATVSVTQATPDADATPDQIAAALYGMTRQLMDQMNVQLQYQIQHSLSSWVSYAPGVPGGSVAGGSGIQATPLAAPAGVTPAPATGSPPMGVLGTLPVGDLPPAPATPAVIPPQQ